MRPELDEPSAYAEPSVCIETFHVCHYIHSQNVRVGIFTQKPFSLIQPMRALLLAIGQFLIGKWKPNKILLRSLFLISVQPRPGGIWPKKNQFVTRRAPRDKGVAKARGRYTKVLKQEFRPYMCTGLGASPFHPSAIQAPGHERARARHAAPPGRDAVPRRAGAGHGLRGEGVCRRGL